MHSKQPASVWKKKGEIWYRGDAIISSFLFTERRVPPSALFLLSLSLLNAYSFVRIHLEQARRIKRMPRKRVKPAEEMKMFFCQKYSNRCLENKNRKAGNHIFFFIVAQCSCAVPTLTINAVFADTLRLLANPGENFVAPNIAAPDRASAHPAALNPSIVAS